MLTNLSPVCDRVASQVGSTVDPGTQLSALTLAVVDKDGATITRDEIIEGLASTATGKAVAQAANAAAVRTAAGAGAMGGAVFTAADLAAVLIALGAELGAEDSGGTGYRAIVVEN